MTDLARDAFWWTADAACKRKPVAMFFPEAGSLTDANHAALALCQTCPVREHCLNHALEHKEPGIWGGTVETERRKIRRSRMRPNQLWRYGWQYEDARLRD